MPTSFTAATTRTAGAVRKGDRTELLPVAHVITSPETRTQLSDRTAARSGRLRPGLSGTAARTIERGARGRVHQGQPAHRRMAARSVFRPAARRSPSRDSRLRRVSSQCLGAIRSCTALRSSTRSTEISARSSSATIAPWAESSRASGDRRRPRGAREASSRPDAPPRSDADERVRLRQPPPQAGRLRHRATAKRSARHHGEDDERADRAERVSCRRGTKVAGAR